jgi:hypothetical protein
MDKMSELVTALIIMTVVAAVVLGASLWAINAVSLN